MEATTPELFARYANNARTARANTRMVEADRECFCCKAERPEGFSLWVNTPHWLDDRHCIRVWVCERPECRKVPRIARPKVSA